MVPATCTYPLGGGGGPGWLVGRLVAKVNKLVLLISLFTLLENVILSRVCRHLPAARLWVVRKGEEREGREGKGLRGAFARMKREGGPLL